MRRPDVCVMYDIRLSGCIFLQQNRRAFYYIDANELLARTVVLKHKDRRVHCNVLSHVLPVSSNATDDRHSLISFRFSHDFESA